MKKLIITCALVVVGSMASFAQSAHAARSGSGGTATAGSATAASPEQMAEIRAKQYKKELSLSSEQYTSVYESLLDYYRQDKITRENGGPGTGQAMQMQMSLDQRVQAAVTADQFTKYNKIKGKL